MPSVRQMHATRLLGPRRTVNSIDKLATSARSFELKCSRYISDRYCHGFAQHPCCGTLATAFTKLVQVMKPAASLPAHLNETELHTFEYFGTAPTLSPQCSMHFGSGRLLDHQWEHMLAADTHLLQQYGFSSDYTLVLTAFPLPVAASLDLDADSHCLKRTCQTASNQPPTEVVMCVDLLDYLHHPYPHENTCQPQTGGDLTRAFGLLLCALASRSCGLSNESSVVTTLSRGMPGGAEVARHFKEKSTMMYAMND